MRIGNKRGTAMQSLLLAVCLLCQASSLRAACPPIGQPMPREVLEKIVVALDPAYAWRDGRELGRQILMGDDLRCLPASVDPAFRNPRNYDAAGHLLKSNVSCSSFAINDYFNPYYGGSWQGAVGGTFAVCDVAEQQFLIANDKFRSAYAKLEPEHGPSCPSGSYMIVPYARGGRFSPHVLRQLPTGQFAHVTGMNGGQVQLFYSRRVPSHDFEPITRYLDLPDSGELNRCKAICIQPRSNALASQPRPGVLLGGQRDLTGNWAAVTPKADERPVPFTKGFRCGPFLVNLFLRVGLPQGYSFPGGVTFSGPDAMALDVMSNIVEGTRDQVDDFGYTGAYGFLWAKRNVGDPQSLAFRQFHFQSNLLRKARTTGQPLPRLVDASKGIVVRILEQGDQTFKARVEWDSPCSKDLTFHRTVGFRGRVQVVHR